MEKAHCLSGLMLHSLFPVPACFNQHGDEKLQGRRPLCVWIGPFLNDKNFHKTLALKSFSVYQSVHENASMPSTFMTTFDAGGPSFQNLD